MVVSGRGASAKAEAQRSPMQATLWEMTDKRRELEDLRHEIGTIDAQLLSLLERRGKLSRRSGDLQKSVAAPPALPDLAGVEELLGEATGDLPPAALRAIFREIVTTCFALEQSVVVAYSGPSGAFTHAAARSRFGVAAEYLGAESVSAAVDEVSRQRAGYAVVPFETRADGLVQSTIEALTESDMKIVGAFELVVNLQLASKASSVAEIDKVYATPNDRARCEAFLAREMPGAQVLDVRTPLGACQLAADDPRAAALVHEGFAADFALEKLELNVRDDGDERVRYAIVGARPAGRTGTDLTGMVVSVNDAPGALHEILRQFAERGVNLTKIQSRPMPGEHWRYLFFMEVEGHATDRALVGAIEEIRRLSRFSRVLGSYQLT